MNSLNEALLEDISQDCQLRKFTTTKTYRNTVARFLRFLESIGEGPLGINKSALKKYLIYLEEDRRLQFRSLEKAFDCISAFYDFLEEEAKMPTNPVPSFRKRYLRQLQGRRTIEAEVPERRRVVAACQHNSQYAR